MMSSLEDADYAPEGFADKVGYAKYPGDVMIGSMEQSSWCITTDYGQMSLTEPSRLWNIIPGLSTAPRGL